MDEIDTWRTADLLVKLHGREAMFIATRRADGFWNQGDPDACGAWIRMVSE